MTGRCGAGHWCCSELDGPPLHDHFLSSEVCPSCAKPTAQGVRAPGGGEALPIQGQSEGTP